MDFANLRAEEDDGEEVELVFDDADLAAFMAPAPAAPPPPIVLAVEAEPEPDAKPAKKRPAKGKALPTPEPEPEPAAEPAPPPPVAEMHEAPAPAVVAAPAPGRLVLMAVLLAAFASILSAVGVVVTARNIAVLSQTRSDAAERQALLARLPALIASIEQLRDAQRVELARTAALTRGTPVTLPDLRRELDNTRLALGKSQPAGLGQLGGILRTGQTELVTRLQELSRDVAALRPKPKASN